MSYHPHRDDCSRDTSYMSAQEMHYAFEWARDEDGAEDAMTEAWDEYTDWPLQIPKGWCAVDMFQRWEWYVKPTFIQTVIDKYLEENPLEDNQ